MQNRQTITIFNIYVMAHSRTWSVGFFKIKACHACFVLPAFLISQFVVFVFVLDTFFTSWQLYPCH